MKKLNFRLVFMTAFAICSTAFVSCSNDDEDSSNGGGEVTSKRVKKITDEYEGRTTTITFDYDSHGRVIKKHETSKEPGFEWEHETTYAYGENTISSKEKTFTNNGDNGTHTYTLSDGRIIKDVWNGEGSPCTYNYTYDDNGYLKSVARNSSETNLIWNGGNLTEILWDFEDLQNQTISYSNIPCPINWMFSVKYLSTDNALQPLGVWGKTPKNMPSKEVLSGNGGSYELTYDYTIEKDVITKIIITGSGEMYGYPKVCTDIITIEWE